MKPVMALFFALVLLPSFTGAAAPVGIIKVFPLFLDTNGVDATSPSLFDRDAYQSRLRNHPDEVSAMRFDILWKGDLVTSNSLTLRAELRGVGDHALPTVATLETNLAPKITRRWTSLKFAGTDYKNFGTLTAWRVTLWDGDKMLDEQKSFLW
jgi:hypothetical protein